MALSAEEKNRRKQLRNERDRAWHARRKERNAIQEAGELAIKAKYNPIFDAYFEREALCRTKIDAAESVRKVAIAAANEAYCRAVEQAKAEVGPDDRPFKEKDEDQRRLDAKLAKEFPDLVGSALWSAAAWKPLDKIK
jgi:hypothetical protein